MYPLGRIDQVHVSCLRGNKYSVFTAKLYIVSTLYLQKNCAYCRSDVTNVCIVNI